MQDSSELLRATESTGEAFLKLCQILRSQGVDLTEQPHLQQIISQIETSISAKPANPPRPVSSQPQQIPVTEPKCAKHIEPSPLFLTDPEYANLIKPGPLRPGDYRIDQINGSQYLQRLQKALRNHTARAEFPVGTIIPDIWTDRKTGAVYSMPLIIVDYRNVQTTQYGERFGAILLRQNASPYPVVFDEYDNNDFAEPSLRSWLNAGGDYARGCSDNLIRTTADVIVDGLALRFFPPSAEEVHLDPDRNPELENLVWEYFRNTPIEAYKSCPKRVFLDPGGIASTWGLRSAYRAYTYYERCISSSGSLYSNYAYNSYRVVPAGVVIT